MTFPQENRTDAQKHVEVTIKPAAGQRSSISHNCTSMKEEKREPPEVGHLLQGKLT